MPNFLEITADKFIFRVAEDRLYTQAGLWALGEEKQVRIGLSDFVQQRSGDVAFAEVRPVGTVLAVEDEVAVIETIKVNISLGSPVAGLIIEINPGMSEASEAINQDPYGAGWVAVIEAEDWNADRKQLLEPKAYLAHIKSLIEQELKEK